VGPGLEGDTAASGRRFHDVDEGEEAPEVLTGEERFGSVGYLIEEFFLTTQYLGCQWYTPLHLPGEGPRDSPIRTRNRTS